MKLNYLLLDVFTTERLKGNPLAVVLNADPLLDDQMQAIAAEFNLSETVFIMRPQATRHTAAVRIFTPRVELPFAGHPTVGAAIILAQQTRSSAIRLEEQVGIVTCIMEKVEKNTGFARFALPVLPGEAGSAPSRARIAGTLGLELEDIGCEGMQAAVYSAGVVFYLVPVRDAQALKKIVPERRGWRDVYPLGTGAVYAFTATPEERENAYAARMFTTAGEDPATGSAAAALIGLLAPHRDPGQHDFVVRQGYEMGRPSQIHVQYRMEGDVVTHGAIGGHAVIVGEGVLDLGD